MLNIWTQGGVEKFYKRSYIVSLSNLFNANKKILDKILSHMDTLVCFFLVQYRLEIQDGKVVWFHRDSRGYTLFSATTDAPVVLANVWSHILVTYTVATGTAQIFINGELKKEEVKDAGDFLSTDWDKYVGKGMSLNLV